MIRQWPSAGGGGVALDGDYADPDQLGSGKSGTAPGQAKQRLAADQTWSEPLEHFAESWDETYKVSALTGREDPADAEATVHVALKPKGNGGVQASVPDGTSTGGNARGNFAVDLQVSRALNTQVASGAAAVIAGGQRNTSSNIYTSVGGGYTNAATQQYATIAGGDSNTASGTHSTIAGGDSNSASGSNSSIGGGGSNTTTNNYAVVGGGFSNDATNTYAVIGGGQSNTASANSSSVLGGQGSTASGQWSTVLGGYINLASALFSTAWGQRAIAAISGQTAFANGRFSADGDAQQSFLTLRNSTSDATQTELFADGASARITVPSGSRFRFRVDIICTNETDNTGNAYEIKGAIKNIAGTTSLIGTNVSNVWEDDAAFAAVVEADDTNDALVVKVTGAAGKTCRWVASVHLVQVT